MTKHVHDWGYGDNQDPMGSPDWWMACSICHKIMTVDEIARRLNATERLSADAADYGADFTQVGTNRHGMDQESEGNIYYLTDALRAYADERNNS